MVVILVFILQNQATVEVTFLVSRPPPARVALLFSLILGAVIVVGLAPPASCSSGWWPAGRAASHPARRNRSDGARQASIFRTQGPKPKPGDPEVTDTSATEPKSAAVVAAGPVSVHVDSGDVKVVVAPPGSKGFDPAASTG